MPSLIPSLRTKSSHADVVCHYIHHRRHVLHEELGWFSDQPNFSEALAEAVNARDQWGKRLSHQRRLLKHVLPNAFAQLSAMQAQLKRAKSFDALFERVDQALNSIPNAGDLYSYDTALRLGAFLRLFPTRVFLQTGALSGALKISSSMRQRSVPLCHFPEPFHSLAPFEVENLLCCYKNHLKP